MVLALSRLGAYIVLDTMHSIAFSYSFFHGVFGSQERSPRMAIHEACLTGEIITGPIVGGTIYQNNSIRTVSVFFVVVTACVIVDKIVLSLYTLLFLNQAARWKVKQWKKD